MHFTVTKEKFQQAVARADKITGKNLSLPVLRSVLIVAGGSSVKIRATNLDVGIELSVPAKITKEGVVAIPSETLTHFLSALYTSGNVVVKESGGGVTFESDGSTTTIHTLPHDDFPTLPKVDGGSEFTLPADALVKGFRSVWYAAATSSIKPELASVYLYSEDNHLIFVATDSFRLAEKRVPAKVKTFSPLLIPIKNANEIARNLEETNADISVRVAGSQIVFVHDDIYLTSRLVDGTFPDYKQLIPKTSETDATVLKQEFSQSLKVATVFSNKFNQIRLTISPKKKTLTVTTSNPEVGEQTLSIDAALSGDSVESSFNHRYITDSLQSIPTDSVQLLFNGKNKPMLLKGVGDASFTYLVMPMNK